jgi:ADP-L-glycero-D-manno-heptose 6-epimerase
MQTNVNTFYDLLEIAKINGSVMIYASSAAVYGNLPPPQIVGNESPENIYGYSKYMMEQIARQYGKENPDMVIVGLRFFNVYGPREYYKAKTASMVIQLGHQILSGKAPRLFNGSNKIMRDFIYIDDIIQANIRACDTTKSGIYNVGTGKPRSFQDIADLLQQELGTNLGTEYFPNPYDGYQMDTQADISATQANLNFEPKVSLEAGIKAYIPEIRRLHNEDIS